MTKSLISEELRQQIADQLAASKKVQSKVAATIAGTMKLAIVGQTSFYARPCCPHCGSLRYPDLKWVMNEEAKPPSRTRLVGDVAVCLDCLQPLLILLYPVIPAQVPIFLYWKMDGKKEEVKEVDESIASKEPSGAGVGAGVSSDEGTA